MTCCPIYELSPSQPGTGVTARLRVPVVQSRITSAEAAWLEGRTADVLTEVGFATDGLNLDPLA